MANEEKIRILDEQPAENAGSLLYIRTLAGSSDASKPTSLLANGSIFIETDTGKVFIFDEDNGWTEMQAGDALPPVTPSDNGKVLGVVDGEWAAQANDVVLNATVAYDDSGANYDVTITSVLPSAEDLEAYFNEKRSIVLHFTDVPLDARLQPELKEVDSSMGTYYSFIGEGLGFDYDKLKYVIRFNVDNVETVSYVGKVYIGDKFIVTLTPTELDYSGTMDKTPAEITAAYNAGQKIVFNIPAMNAAVDADQYVLSGVSVNNLRFGAKVFFDVNNAPVLITIVTSGTDDAQTYLTGIYSLTPAS